LLKTISNYEKYLASSRQKQSLLTAKIQQQKAALQNASPSISQVHQEQELLDKITQERTQLEQKIKLAESELKTIKKEKAALERQIKAKKKTVTAAKKKESAKVKRLKQKKKILEKEVKTETTKIKKMVKELS
jgi:uncharacterized protein involved in exopolysaccharide biosynthesis